MFVFYIHLKAFCHLHIASVIYFTIEKQISQSDCVVLSKNVTFLLRMWIKITNFVASEGRNPWFKNAFLALSRLTKSPISTQRDEDNATLILSLHMQGRVQSFVAVHFYPYMRQRGVFVSQFISAWCLAIPDLQWARQVSTLFLYTMANTFYVLLISGDL